MKKYLHIGGPVDGKWLENDGRDYQRVATAPEMRWRDYKADDVYEMKATEATYMRVDMICEGSTISIYLHEDIARKHDTASRSEVVFHMLVSGYAKQRAPEIERRDRWDVQWTEAEIKRVMVEPPKYDEKSAEATRELMRYGEQMRDSELEKYYARILMGERQVKVLGVDEAEKAEKPRNRFIPFNRIRGPNDAPRSFKGDKK